MPDKRSRSKRQKIAHQHQHHQQQQQKQRQQAGKNGAGHGEEEEEEGMIMLSHNEIWDDSALIDSWNAALREYEYYHSLARTGGDGGVDLEALLDEVEREDRVGNGEEGEEGEDDGDGDGSGSVEEGEVEEGEAEEGEVAGNREGDVKINGVKMIGPQLPTMTVDGGQMLEKEPQPYQQPQRQEGMGNGEMETGAAAQEQTLENVKMAYYWAGYYSGVYDQQLKQAAEKGKGG